MFQPDTYGIALLLMLISMFCWGSWANTQKLTGSYSFQLFYWDYVLGILLASLLWGVTLGTLHGGPTAFFADLSQASGTAITYALIGGIIFNVANLLLVASIAIAGMAVAFPVGIGLALVVGVVFNYIVQPRGNPLLLFGGLILIVVAIVVDAIAYRRREPAKGVSRRGVRLAIASGILMGLFYPFVARAGIVVHPLGPYSVAFVFSLGVLLCAIPFNAWLMRHPITGEPPVSMSGYWRARAGWHFWGIVGGMIWCTGALSNFVASHTQVVGPAISYAIGQGATMISAAWGVFIWREFANAPANSRRLIPIMFISFLFGLAAIAIAPLY
ncbi:MAG TPA: GRP family sugar transporter [Acidobacteriaceae bacterium]|jgi:glucose uptake protein|nr:GRP family sugar transporter [Acidobacteriaceae bacterium]